MSAVKVLTEYSLPNKTLHYAYDIIGTNQETHRFMRVAGWFVLLYYNMII